MPVDSLQKQEGHGEHGAAILVELGIDPATIARLRTENILRIPEGT